MKFPKFVYSISGWIQPDGKWHPSDEWWHISAIYELKDLGCPYLQDTVTNKILKEGDEIKIKKHISDIGFIKISRAQIDGNISNTEQLFALQNLLSLCNPDEEIGILGHNGVLKNIRIARIMKLKNPRVLSKIKKEDINNT
jgi:hypothetical protein